MTSLPTSTTQPLGMVTLTSVQLPEVIVDDSNELSSRSLAYRYDREIAAASTILAARPHIFPASVFARHLTDGGTFSPASGNTSSSLGMLKDVPTYGGLDPVNFLSICEPWSSFDFIEYTLKSFGDAWRTSRKFLLSSRIEGFALRKEGWDGEGGTMPNLDARLDARAFLFGLSEEIALPASVFSPGDGEVIFQWRKRSDFVEVGFYGDGTISWYAKVRGEPAKHNDCPFDRQNPSDFDESLNVSIRIFPV